MFIYSTFLLQDCRGFLMARAITSLLSVCDKTTFFFIVWWASCVAICLKSASNWMRLTFLSMSPREHDEKWVEPFSFPPFHHQKARKERPPHLRAGRSPVKDVSSYHCPAQPAVFLSFSFFFICETRLQRTREPATATQTRARKVTTAYYYHGSSLALFLWSAYWKFSSFDQEVDFYAKPCYFFLLLFLFFKTKRKFKKAAVGLAVASRSVSFEMPVLRGGFERRAARLPAGI